MSTPSPQMILRRTVKAEDLRGTQVTFNRATLARIWGFVAGQKRPFVLFILVSIAAAGIGVITPVLAGDIVNAINARGPLRTVVWLSIIIGVIALVDAGLSLASRYFSSRVGEGLIYSLRTAVFDHVLSLPVAFFSRTRTGALVSRLSTDVIGAQRAFSSTLSSVVSNLVTLLLTLAVMFSISWTITLASLVLLPVFLIPARFVARRLGALQTRAANLNADMSTRMTERFSAGGATLIKLFGRPTAESEEFSLRAGRVRDIGVRTAVLQGTFVAALTLVSALAVAVVYGIGGWQAVVGNLSAGAVVTLAMLLTKLYTPLTMLANAHLDVVAALVSFNRVFEVLDLKPLICEAENPRELPAGPKGLRFTHVDFTYPTAAQTSLPSLEEGEGRVAQHEGGQVLHDIDFEVPAGGTVALVGSSGAGKSTIASLIPRLYDVDSGRVSIGGVDVRELSFRTLKDAVGMVTQDGHLFHDTIRGNLLLARPDAGDEDLADALERAQLSRLVAALPDGVDTMIGERGYRLSGGERQRLTIARLLLAEPEVIVMDEATSALDNTSEAAVQAALDEAMAGRTSVVIAHRLSTVVGADLILVVEDGRILERGDHSSLMATDGRYAELYRTQFAHLPS
ncbi:ABC transporter ATP-binding protein/permease [Brevibacterium sp. 91QC2O2]|uniref:ABC transporter ATP-binding protein n=1 Tax=Brevibacterium TaxID=1696 RepID=UPI00211C3F0D|nr:MULTISPECIES: ABC transporter ATP-binding protein [unclassified Brevibacterium]MCQ9367437.1 ABC transporter ATP-binding protein/permease [Brevibacterium sp. 91QC2O2]MCQ9384549.1 ABC transporter ATP-binding protein/permease [Brevibacterium sp. 68QC2CO]